MSGNVPRKIRPYGRLGQRETPRRHQPGAGRAAANDGDAHVTAGRRSGRTCRRAPLGRPPRRCGPCGARTWRHARASVPPGSAGLPCDGPARCREAGCSAAIAALGIAAAWAVAQPPSRCRRASLRRRPSSPCSGQQGTPRPRPSQTPRSVRSLVRFLGHTARLPTLRSSLSIVNPDGIALSPGNGPGSGPR